MRSRIQGLMTAVPSALLGLLAAVTLSHASNLPISAFLVSAVIGAVVGGVAQRSGSSLVFAAPTSLLVLTGYVYGNGGLAAVAAFSILVGLMQVGLVLSPVARWLPLIPERIHQGILLGLGALILWKALRVGLPADGEALFATSTLISLGICGAALIVMSYWKSLVPTKINVFLPAIIVAGALTVALQLMLRGAAHVCGADCEASLSLLPQFDIDAMLQAFVSKDVWLSAVSAALISASKMNAVPQQSSEFEAYRQNVFALAATNLFCGLFCAPPVAVITERSAISLSGGPSRMTIVAQGPLIGLMLLAYGTIVNTVPPEFMLAVLLWTSWRFMEVKNLVSLWRRHRSEAVTVALVALAVLSFDISLGVLLGIGIGFVRLAWTFAQDYEITVLSSEDNPTFAIVQMRGAFTFACLPALDNELRRLTAVTQLIIDQTGVYYSDSSLEQYVQKKQVEFTAAGRDLVVKQGHQGRRQSVRHSVLTKADIQALDRRKKAREGRSGRRQIDHVLQQAKISAKEIKPAKTVVKSPSSRKSA